MAGRLARPAKVRREGAAATRFRAEWDYLSFILTRMWPLALGIAGALAAVLTLVPGP
jgi:hypothetical protein